MDSVLVGQVGLVLGSVGFALQWLRAQRGFPEWAFYLLACVITAGGCWMAMDATVHVTRKLVLESWPVYVTLLGTTLGGTASASNAAKGLAAARPGIEEHGAVPLTNSKD
jgi:hypothetical protein